MGIYLSISARACPSVFVTARSLWGVTSSPCPSASHTNCSRLFPHPLPRSPPFFFSFFFLKNCTCCQPTRRCQTVDCREFISETDRYKFSLYSCVTQAVGSRTTPFSDQCSFTSTQTIRTVVLGTGSSGRPPPLSHSSCVLDNPMIMIMWSLMSSDVG